MPNSTINLRQYTSNAVRFPVCMWGKDEKSAFLNGVEINTNEIFYDILIPFLPEDAVEDLELYLEAKRNG